MTPIAVFADKATEAATLARYQELEPIELTDGLTITINNTAGAESGARYAKERLEELSLTHCYSLADVVWELTAQYYPTRTFAPPERL